MPGQERPLTATIRKLALPVAFLVVALPLGIGTVMAMGGHEDTTSEPSPFRSIAGDSGRRDEPRAQPRWERVATFTGNGPAERSFAIANRAVQWKADWSCTAGEFRVAVGRPSQEAAALATSSCPDVGVESSTGHGAGNLQVSASGPWRVIVRQQVDTALEEPPLAGMTPRALLARGRFHPIQKHGEGTVSLYRLANGRLALRFENFYTSPSPGLRLWLSRARNVTSTLQARQSRYSDAGPLRSTLGSYNKVLPATTTADEVRTVVIWCPTVLIAFSAAPLEESRAIKRG
ncbi:MAG: DM13 domain-containing protein [Solirubrobacteraceae bacterium]